MITTSANLTLNLAIAFGIYMIAAGVGGFLDRDRFPAIMDELRTRPALTYVTGAFVFALGVALILVHNKWDGVLSGLVSFVGWAAAAEGLLMLAVPKPFLDFFSPFLKPSYVTSAALFAVAVGALLLLLGLAGTVG